MRKAAVLVGALVLAGCSSEPAAPTPPPAPRYPQMVGGWNGIQSRVWTTNTGRGAQTCAEVWVITQQENATFSGTGQMTGNDCADAGLISGTVTLDGIVTVRHGTSTSGGPSSPCRETAGDPTFTGTVSASGGLTATRNFFLRCVGGQYGNGVVYQMAATLTMNRR